MTPGQEHRKIRDRLVALAAAHGYPLREVALAHMMSPAGTSDTGSCSLPRITESWWSRSSCIVRPFTRVASAFIVPCSTLNRFTWPT